MAGHALLTAAGIPTAPLAAHGRLDDGRSFVIFADLAGYTPADKRVAAGEPFEPLLVPTADLAADLHAAGLHHRDLYLCHFMVRPDPFDVRLIDVARVARLANPLTRRRWVVKDLAQFWYSTTQLAVTDEQRRRWLDRYAARRDGRRWAATGPAEGCRHRPPRRAAEPTASRCATSPSRPADVHPTMAGMTRAPSIRSTVSAVGLRVSRTAAHTSRATMPATSAEATANPAGLRVVGAATAIRATSATSPATRAQMPALSVGVTSSATGASARPPARGGRTP